MGNFSFSIKGYKIIFDTALNSSKVQIGDIIGIKNNNNMEIGVIRRIVQLTEHKLQLGIKLLALESEVAYISLPNHDSIYAWAIFLPGIKKIMSSDSLIYNDSKFQCGEFVNLHRTGTEPASCRLNKLLHLSCAAMHVELFNSKIQARHATSRNSGTPVAIIRSPTQRMGDALNALRPQRLRTKAASSLLPHWLDGYSECNSCSSRVLLAHVESANCPVAYQGLKITTSLSSVSMIFSDGIKKFTFIPTYKIRSEDLAKPLLQCRVFD